MELSICCLFEGFFCIRSASKTFPVVWSGLVSIHIFCPFTSCNTVMIFPVNDECVCCHWRHLELSTFLTQSLKLLTSVTAIRKPNHQRQALKHTERVCCSSAERRCCFNLERLVQVWLTRRQRHSSADLFHRFLAQLQVRFHLAGSFICFV